MSIPKPLSRLLATFPLWSLLSGLLAGIWLADFTGSGAWLAVAAAAILLALAWRRQAIVLLALGLIAGSGMHGLQTGRQMAWIEAAQGGQLPTECTLRGTIIDTGPQQDGPYLLRVSELQPPPAPALRIDGLRVLLTRSWHSRDTLRHGDIISISGQLQGTQPMRNPHGFDRQRWLHRLGVNLSLSPREPVTVLGVNPLCYPVRIMASWRMSLREKMTAGLDPDSREAQLIRAVVLGERPPRPSAMIDDFRNSGTLHVFAVSGLHVGMVGTIIGGLLWLLRAPRWLMISGIILGMAAYAGITGLRPPSVRAVIMASVLLAGFLIRRQPSLVNSLAASAIVVLLWDGHQLFTPGFQLSYGVLLALALASAYWMRVLRPMAAIDPFMPRQLLTTWQERILGWRKWLRNSLSVSLAAWMGSAPLMWIHFGIITPISILAGIPLMLLVFAILAMAMISIPVTSLWEPAGKTLNRVSAMVAKTTYTTAAAFAQVPGGHWYQHPHRPAKGRIIVFDIPYGGAANFIDIGGGILLDSGRGDHFQHHVLPTLTSLQASPDSLVVSHADAKHSGGMSQCLAHFQPRQALIPRTDLLSKSFREFVARSTQMDCRLVIPRSGQIFPVEPGVCLEILHAPVELAGDGRADDTGLVVRLHWHGWKILFTGDAGYITETRLLDSGLNLSADVIITGRNRDDFTGREGFYRAVSPRAIISSNARFPEGERIPGAWFAMTRSLGITTFDQQQTGAVTLTLDGDKLILTPTLDAVAPLVIAP